ncbi:hypothetical protein PGQ11_010975 [Apiospora arundinis]|uniref:Uncharacterized protein n=1 Tax=Apiospora arundinis TaxID=335852 RepID=A0ABR2HYW4_9PEZI
MYISRYRNLRNLQLLYLTKMAPENVGMSNEGTVPTHRAYIVGHETPVWTRKKRIDNILGYPAWQQVDVDFLGYEWHLQWSYENFSDNPYEENVSTTTSLRVTDYQEQASSFGVSAGFEGWGFSMSVSGEESYKRFKETETMTSKTVESKYTVRAHTSVFLYQKRYNFRVRMMYIVERPGTPQPLTSVDTSVRILAEQYALMAKELEGTGTVSVVSMSKATLGAIASTTQIYSNDPLEQLRRVGIRSFDDLSADAQEKLRGQGVTTLQGLLETAENGSG